MELSLPDNTLNEQSLLKDKLNNISKLNSSVSTVKGHLTDAEKAKFAEASRGFEAIFINMMFKEMKAAQLDDEGGDSEMNFGAEPLEGYMDSLFSEQVSETGKGIGIAEMMYENLTGEKLKATSMDEYTEGVKGGSGVAVNEGTIGCWIGSTNFFLLTNGTKLSPAVLNTYPLKSRTATGATSKGLVCLSH